MGLGIRGAQKRLKRLDADLDGRLLRAIGTKIMPRGPQPSRLLVNIQVLREAIDPERERDVLDELAEVRAEVSLLSQKLESLRKAVRPLLGKKAAPKL